MSWLLPFGLMLGSLIGLFIPALNFVGDELMLFALAFGGWLIAAKWAPASFSLSRLSLMGVFLTTYSTMIMIPTLYWRLAKPYIGGDWFVIGVALVVPLSCLGWFMAFCGMGRRPDDFDAYFSKATIIEAGPGPLAVWAVLASGTVFLSGVHIFLSPVNPFLMLLSGESAAELALAREASFKTLPAGTVLRYLFSWLLSVLFPLTLLWAFGRAWIERTLRWKALAAVAMVTALFYSVFTVAKAPAAMLMGMVLIAGFTLRGRAIKPLQMGLGAAFVLAIPAALMAGISNAGVTDTAIGIARRLLYVPSEALAHYFEAFDKVHPFLNGRSINLVSRILFGEAPFPLANYVYHFIHEGGLETGLSNAAFIGPLWADFGVAGLFVGPVVVGGLIGLSEVIVISGQKTLLKVCLHAILCLQVFFLSSRSITVALLTGGWLPAVVLVLVAGFLHERFNTRPSG